MLYQVRINADDVSSIVLQDILKAANAELMCQFDAFSEYCKEAEVAEMETDNWKEEYPLYHWTKSVLTNPAKAEKYRRNYTVYIDGEQLYSLEVANMIYSRLENLPIIDSIQMHDNNPANNPQIPHAHRFSSQT